MNDRANVDSTHFSKVREWQANQSMSVSSTPYSTPGSSMSSFTGQFVNVNTNNVSYQPLSNPPNCQMTPNPVTLNPPPTPVLPPPATLHPPPTNINHYKQQSDIASDKLSHITHAGPSDLSKPLMCMPYYPLTAPIPSVSSAAVSEETPIVANTTVPEFLYQLTKMLSDDNRTIIEWSNGKIAVHNPHKLASDVLHRYFRHSKYASFQRQLNYFGFRKLAGKGKMAPCSYVNEAATEDLGSILTLKRKAGGKDKRKGNSAQDQASASMNNSSKRAAVVNPVLAGILNTSNSFGKKRDRPTSSYVSSEYLSNVKDAKQKISCSKSADSLPSQLMSGNQSNQISWRSHSPGVVKDMDHRALAKTVVGKGVQHQFIPELPQTNHIVKSSSINDTSQLNCGQTMTGIGEIMHPAFQELSQNGDTLGDSLSQLQSNFNESLKQRRVDDSALLHPGESSLLNLAMIPPLQGDAHDLTLTETQPNSIMTFVDFPSGALDPPIS